MPRAPRNATGCATKPAARFICGCRRGRSSSPQRTMTDELQQSIVDGAYWLRKPGPECAGGRCLYGAIAPEAIAGGRPDGEDRRDIGLLAVTSADRLNAGWTAAQRARERGLVHARSHIERLLDDVPPHCGIVTVLDGHPATLVLARRGAWPPRARARRRAFRPDRFAAGPLPALRHRRQCDHRSRSGD